MMSMPSFFQKNKKSYKKILLIMIPIILSALLQNFVGLIDNFMAAKIPNSDQSISLRAIAISTEIFFFAIVFVWGFESIIMIFLNQFYGAKKFDKFKETIKISLFLNIIIIIFALSIYFFFSDNLIKLFLKKNDEKLISTTKKYLKIIMISFVLVAINISLIQSLIVIGKPNYYYFIGLLSLFSNIIFNYLFTNVWKFGVEGIGISSLVARCLEFFLIVILFIKHKKEVLFNFKLKLDLKIIKAIFKKIAIALSSIIISISFFSFTVIYMRKYEKDVITPIGMGYAIISLLFSIFPGISSATKVLIGKKLGSEKFIEAEKEAKLVIHMTIFLSLIFSIFTLILMIIISPYLLDNKSSVYYLRYMIIVYSIGFIFIALGLAFTSILITGGYSFWPSFINDYFQVILALPIVILLSIFTNIEFEILFAIPIFVNFISSIINYFIYKKRKWLKNIVNENF